MRFYVSQLLAALLAWVPTWASACTILPPSPQEIEQLASDVAANGFLIRGTLVQAFDASKSQPEIIRADEVFIGDKETKFFVIYRSKNQFEAALHPPRGLVTSCYFLSQPPPYKKGQVFDRIVLVHPTASDAVANGRWSSCLCESSVARGRGLGILVEKAKRLGRFRSQPASDGASEH